MAKRIQNTQDETRSLNILLAVFGLLAIMTVVLTLGCGKPDKEKIETIAIAQPIDNPTVKKQPIGAVELIEEAPIVEHVVERVAELDNDKEKETLVFEEIEVEYPETDTEEESPEVTGNEVLLPPPVEDVIDSCEHWGRNHSKGIDVRKCRGKKLCYVAHSEKTGNLVAGCKKHGRQDD